MKTNDDTMLMSGRQFTTQQNNYRAQSNANVQSNNKGAWKKVVFGGATGVLVGAGAMYAANTLATDNSDTDTSAAKANQPEDVKVAKVSDDLSFQDAFDAARAQVGAGGVFRWNGGLYSTYSEDEWNNMSDDDKAAFTQAIRPEVRADEIVAERMSEAEPQVVVVKEQVAAEPQDVAHADDVQPVHTATDNGMAINASAQQETTSDDDVHVLGYGQINGYDAAALDTNGDGQADVAFIDVDGSHSVTGSDILTDGHYYSSVDGTQQGVIDDGIGYPSDPTVDQNTDPTMQQASYDSNPDLSPDMPDYMDDADISGTPV